MQVVELTEACGCWQVLAAFLKAVGFIIPLMEPEHSGFVSKPSTFNHSPRSLTPKPYIINQKPKTKNHNPCTPLRTLNPNP